MKNRGAAPLIFLSFFIQQIIFFNSRIVEAEEDDECVTDTIFLLDSSGSIRHSFEQYRKYVKTLVEQIPISPNGHHVALIVYSGRLRQFTKWALNQQPQEKEKLLDRIATLPHLNGVTATGVALDVMTVRELPKKRQGPRARTNLIVLTDGFSYDSVDVQAANLHRMPDVRTFAVCLDDVRVESDLLTIAGGPQNLFSGQESSAKLLPKLLECPVSARKGNDSSSRNATVEKGIGGGKEATNGSREDGIGSGGVQAGPGIFGTENVEEGGEKATTRGGNETLSRNSSASAAGNTSRDAPRVCPVDFIFVLDASGSLRQRFEHQKEMAIQLVAALPEGREVRIGLIKFSGKGKSRVKLPIDNSLTRAAILQRIREQPFFGGTTFANEALEKALGQLHKGEQDNSSTLGESRRQVVAVFTDGMNQDSDPTAGAKALHAKGTIVFAIAVEDGQPINMRELEMIAGDPSRVFTDKNFDQLQEQLEEFAKNC